MIKGNKNRSKNEQKSRDKYLLSVFCNLSYNLHCYGKYKYCKGALFNFYYSLLLLLFLFIITFIIIIFIIIMYYFRKI